MQFWTEKLPQYGLVQSSEEDVDPQIEQTVPESRTTLQLPTHVLIFGLFQLAALGAVGVLGYVIGTNNSGHNYEPQHQNAYPAKAHGIDTATIRTIERKFDYNHTFAESPGPESDAAWESIFPPHGGFFHDDEIAPTGASLAAYHQLHCLDGIRHAYYLLLDAVKEGHNITFSEVEDYSTDWHTRHCLDFLRQMLMCNADLTIENVNPKLGGILGSGQMHECVVWEDVRDWSLAYQKDVR